MKMALLNGDVSNVRRRRNVRRIDMPTDSKKHQQNSDFKMSHKDGLTCQIKLSYKMQKMANKACGRHRAFEIAVGRKLIKMMLDNYKSKNDLSK
jgi:hypothetical protein